MWVAAVSAMLPPDYRPLLSFATYHHDPYQAQFTITGTTSDSSFRASVEEYISFFILNTQLDKISDIDDSPYAQEAARAARSLEMYEGMLDLFALTIADEEHARRFPLPEYIDEQLDTVALYARVLEQKDVRSLTEQEFQAVDLALTSFEQCTTFTQNDIDELDRLSKILFEISTNQKSQKALIKAVWDTYGRIVLLRKKRGMPGDQLALKHLQRASQYIKDGQRKEAKDYLDSMIQAYGKESLEHTVNDSEYWEWLDPFFDYATIDQLTGFWSFFGRHIHFGQNSERFLLISLHALGKAWNEKRREESAALYTMMAAAKGREQELLSFAVDRHHQLPETTIRRLYCPLVSDFDLEKRAPYRAIVQRVVPDIASYELRYQIRMGGTQNGLRELERWIAYAQRQRMNDIRQQIEAGLNYLRQLVYRRSPEEWCRMASHILMSKTLAPLLPPQWEDRLAEEALSRLSLSNYSPSDVEMCEKYRSREGISTERRVVMDGLLAMKYGTLDRQLSKQLFERFSQLSRQRPEQCRKEAAGFVRQLMTHPLTELEHTLLVNAVFIKWEESVNFWQPYWDTLFGIMADAARAEQAVNVLGYWFAAGPETFRALYTPHYFFLHLPEIIEEWQRERNFLAAVPSIMNAMSSRHIAWSPLAMELLAGRKNLLAAAGRNIAALGQGLAERLRRGIDSRAVNRQDERARAEQRQREEVATGVSRLFSTKNVREAHRRGLQAIYRADLQEMFWEYYWQQIMNLLLSRDATATLDLLAFWFDDAYQVTIPEIYLVPAFFLGFSEAIEATSRERGFFENAHKIDYGARNAGLNWYSLVREYFIGPERRGRKPFFGNRP